MRVSGGLRRIWSFRDDCEMLAYGLYELSDE